MTIQQQNKMSIAVAASRRHAALQVAIQLIVLSVLTLATVAAFTHIATMLIFRRLVLGGHKPPNRQAIAPSACEGILDEPWTEEFFVPARSILTSAASVDDILEQGSHAVVRWMHNLSSSVRLIPSSIQRGIHGDGAVTGEIYVRCYHFTSKVDGGEMLILCNPSGETVDTVYQKTVPLARAIGFDSLVLFDYRPTGRSCKGLVAPDTATMFEDAQSVMQWLTKVKDVSPAKISIAGISLGGIQAIRLAHATPSTKRLFLLNTFSSFYCMLGNAAPVLFPGALRIGRTSDFLPNLNEDLKTLATETIVVVSVENDQRIPARCTEEMVTALQSGGNARRIMHLQVKGTHSTPIVDYHALELIREFLRFSEDI